MSFNSEVQQQFADPQYVVTSHDGVRMISISSAATAITAETKTRVTYSDIDRELYLTNNAPLFILPYRKIGNQRFYIESEMYRLCAVIVARKLEKKAKRYARMTGGK